MRQSSQQSSTVVLGGGEDSFRILKHPIADAKIRVLAKGRDLFEGKTRPVS